MTHQKKRNYALNFDTLEARELMAAGITANLNHGLLKVDGTTLADQIEVREEKKNIIVLDSKANKEVARFATTDVKNIEINSGDGDDVLRHITTKHAVLKGGTGNDRLIDNGQTKVRPTLAVVIHGLWLERDSGWKEWNQYAEKLRDTLEKQGSTTVTWTINWDGMLTPDQPMAELRTKIREFLGQQSETWDVFFLTHSRGAVMAGNLSIGTHANLGKVQAILLDPTASNIQGDNYPIKLPTGTSAVQYDDLYILAPTVTDGTKIKGAEYKNVHTNMMAYKSAHQKDAVWLDRMGTLASATDKALNLIAANSNYGPYASVANSLTSAVVAVKDAALSHVMITDWYVKDGEMDKDVRAFVSSKPNADFFETHANVKLVPTVLGTGSDKVSVNGIVKSLVNIYRWQTDLGVTMLENTAIGVGSLLVDVVAKGMINPATKSQVIAAGNAILKFAPKWFGLYRMMENEAINTAMNALLRGMMDPVIKELESSVASGSITLTSGSLKTAISKFDAAYLGERLFDAIKKLNVSSWVVVVTNVSGATLNGFLRSFGDGDFLKIAKGLKVADLRKVFAEVPWARTLQILQNIDTQKAAEALLNDWARFSKALKSLSAKRIGDIIWIYNGQDFTNALSKMTDVQIFNVLVGYSNWDRFKTTLGHLDFARIGNVIWNYNGAEFTQALLHLNDVTIAKVIWEYRDWNKFKTSLGHLSVEHIGRVIWNYNGSDFTDALKQLSNATLAKVLWSYNWDQFRTSLGHLSWKRASDVIFDEYSWDELKQVFNHIDFSDALSVIKQYSPSRQKDVLKHLGTDLAAKLAKELGISGITSGGGILGGIF